MSTTGSEENYGWWRTAAEVSEKLPELRFAEWRETKDTLHLYLQILGKARMQLTPPRNHWWHVTLYVDTRGLTTRRLYHRDTTFDIRLDFVEHALVVSTDDGRTEGFPLLAGLSVASVVGHFWFGEDAPVFGQRAGRFSISTETVRRVPARY